MDHYTRIGWEHISCHCDVWVWLTAHRSRWSDFIDVVASIGGHDRFPVLALMGRQVLLTHDAAPLLDGSYNGFCDSALVEPCMQEHSCGAGSAERSDNWCCFTVALTM